MENKRLSSSGFINENNRQTPREPDISQYHMVVITAVSL